MNQPASRITLLLPALNEEQALPQVFAQLPRELFSQIIVVDNGSTDCTAEVARQLGATVVREFRRGYGQACLTGLTQVADDTGIVVFLDADGSDVPSEIEHLLAPILAEEADLVIGSRVSGQAEPGALRWQQRWGNRLATLMIRALYGVRYTDLGPCRAIRWRALRALDLQDRNYGWTAEMQIKAAQRGLRIREVPVSYRRRIGESKISGTIRGTLLAGGKIIWTILRLRFSH